MVSREPTGNAAAAYPASVGASSDSLGKLQESGQSQDFLSAQRANHNARLRLSNSLLRTNRSELSLAAAGGGRGAAELDRQAWPQMTPT